MEELNLITCMNYLKKIIFRLEDFIDEKNYNKKDIDLTLENIEGIKEGLIQLLWTEEVFNKIFEKVKIVKNKYRSRINPIISELEYKTSDDLITQNNNFINIDSFKLPAFDIFHPSIKSDLESINWEEKQEIYENIDQTASLYELGYPGGMDNIVPLKKLLFNPYRNCIGTYDINFNLSEKKHNIVTSFDENIILNHIEGIHEYKCDDGAKINLPVIDSIENIPENIYYYYGKDDIKKRGIYSRISNNIIVKIPNITVIPENLDHYKYMTVKCNRDKCNNWNCTYVHPGMPYNKIGYTRRCPSESKFSNTNTLKKDLSKVNYEDIRICILYLITDLFAINLWCHHPNYKIKKSLIIDDIELCGNFKNPFIDNDIVWEKENNL